MKDKKIIAYKKERTKKIAFNLRKLIIKVVMDEDRRLGKEKVKHKSQKERISIEDERNDLLRMLRASICECPCCHQAGRDMYYNASLKKWYCTQCVQEYRDYYRKQKAIHGDLYGKTYDDEGFYKTFL